jgi:diguanylate cyclase (GGDEF)-like protein
VLVGVDAQQVSYGWSVAALRRAGASLLAVLLGIAGLAGLGAWSLIAVSAQAHRQAVSASVEDARVITRLTAARDVGADDLSGPLSRWEVADLDGDVSQLRSKGLVLAFAVWRSDGTVLYRAGITASMPGRVGQVGQVGTVPAGGSSVYFFHARVGSRRPPVGAVEVLLALPMGAGRHFVVGVVIPSEQIVNSSTWANRQLTVGVLAVLLLAAVGLWTLRRRLLAQDHQSHHDPMTGIGNRALLERAARRPLADGSGSGLLLMDLDGFKRINDTLGHAAGDELLVQLAERLSATVRPDDVLVRLGGDEFAVFVRQIGVEHARSAAERLLAAARGEFSVGGLLVDCDASVGVATAPRDGSTLAELLRAADIAMYHAKRGKLGVCVFSDLGQQVDTSGLQQLVELRTAISAGQLRLHYQPAVAVQPGAPDFVEALVRWEHPVRGLLAPGQFIQLAEDTALIHPLTAWVLNEAVAQCANWLLDGLKVCVAVNISSRSLTHPGLVALVTDTLARHQLPASGLHLEVTESAIIAQPDRAREVLTRLRDRGVTISIDDFGAGYTSLAHLRTLPVDVLKIDRSFVSHLVANHTDEAIVTSIINLGHGLGMYVVAEGVEDQPTLDTVTRLGCDIAQGFYLSRPLTAENTTRWLHAHSQADHGQTLLEPAALSR